MQYNSLPDELRSFLREKFGIMVHGAYTERGSKTVSFYCNDERMRDILYKQYYVGSRGIIISEGRYGGYVASMTKKPTKVY